MDDISLNSITANHAILYDKLFISRNDQVDLTYISTEQKVSQEPLDMVVALLESIESEKINALCIIREQTIVGLIVRSQEVISEVLKFLNGLLSNILYIALDNPLESDIQILTSLDFKSPVFVDGKITLYKTLDPSPEFTQMEIRRMETYANQPFIKLNIGVSKDTLGTLSGYVNSFDNEVGGVLHISAYDNQDKAIVRFNTQELIVGEAASVLIPFDTISFHTHPDLCYITLGCYIGWPSSQDMIFLLTSYFSDKPTLLHLVSTAEGIWVMQLTPTFQRILSYLHLNNRNSCIQTIIDLILDKFTKLHEMRQLNIVPPLLRSKYRRDYEALVKIITLADLFELYPDLKSQCSEVIIADGQLYNITLTSWDEILTSDKDLDVTLVYLSTLKYPITLPITYGKAVYNKVKNLPEADTAMEVDLS